MVKIVEKFKKVLGYEDYAVSNKGRVRSRRCSREKILKQRKGKDGYFRVTLQGSEKPKNFLVHKLMAVVFLKHKPKKTGLVVDHKDNNKENNDLNNLQLITNRENCSKDKKSTSKYTGVSWDENRGKWVAAIQIKGKQKWLGYFKNEKAAARAYKKALTE